MAWNTKAVNSSIGDMFVVLFHLMSIGSNIYQCQQFWRIHMSCCSDHPMSTKTVCVIDTGFIFVIATIIGGV